ncbi:MAG: murein biosynthesis integral membrane protein MurJ [Proteobacteria bacterium]|nr:murein biosynthesis integral membrane protein MurJ [Pseudomonadota bacterium]
MTREQKDRPQPGSDAAQAGQSAPLRLARAAGLISAATMLSRLLGLVREQLFAALLGASLFADAFNVAFRIPNLLRDLFAEGALAQAFVPTFKEKLKKAGQSSAYDLGNRVAGTLLAIIGTIVLIAAVFAPSVVDAIAGDYRDVAGKFELTVMLTRIMLPFLAVVSLAAVAMGMLNAQDKYTAPALAPACFNVVSITVGMALYLAGTSGRWVAIGWSIGTVVGGLAQLGIQIPSLWKIGFRPRLRTDVLLRNPGVRRVALLMAPAVGGLAAVQINIFVNTMFASSEEGAVSWLNFAFRFLQLPIGVFGVAIATVSTTRYADAAADGDRAAMAEHLGEGLRLVLFLTVPATVGLLLLGEPIVRLIYERGRFSSFDTMATAAALDLFVIGLCAYAGVKVIAPAFYAANMTRIAVYASVGAVAGNLALNITLHPHYGYRILALGTAVAALLNFAVLYVMFGRRISRIAHASLFFYLVRIGLAAALMGVVVWVSYRSIAGWMGTIGLLARLLGALGPVFIGAVAYAGFCYAMGIEELGQFADKISRRLRRRSAGR